MNQNSNVTDEAQLYRLKQIDIKVDRLIMEVNHCVTPNGAGQIAAYSALLFCFSTINAFGSYASGVYGNYDTASIKKFMTEYMNYKPRTVEILIEIYRHGLVHSASPKAMVKVGSSTCSWMISPNDEVGHLRFEINTGKVLDNEVKINVLHISVKHLALDIAEGAKRLKSAIAENKQLQDNFDKVINDFWLDWKKIK